MTQNEVTIGRGGEDLSVDLPLYTNDEVSREHLRLRRDPTSGNFTVADNSRNGTWLTAANWLAEWKSRCRTAHASRWRKSSRCHSR